MTCTVDGCDRTAKARKLCSSHYTRWRRHGDPGSAVITKHKALTTPEMADELVWQLDAGESAWQAAKAVRMKPATIVKRLDAKADVDPAVRERLFGIFRQLIDWRVAA